MVSAVRWCKAEHARIAYVDQIAPLLQEKCVACHRPAGTRVVFDMTRDNSERNPANPDPNREVAWGDQTWDEMNAGWIRYRELSPGENAAAMAKRK